MKHLSFIFLLMIAGTDLAAQTKKDSPLRSVKIAHDTNNLIDASVPPFYMKLTVELFDDKGNPTEQGSIEEWWAGRDTQKRVYEVPSYSATEVVSPGEIRRSADASYPPPLLTALLKQAVAPVDDIPADVMPEKKAATIGNVQLDCFRMTEVNVDRLNAIVVPSPTYCLQSGATTLRVTYRYGTQEFIRNGESNFLGKIVPKEIRILMGTVTVASARIVELSARPVTDAEVSTKALPETLLVPRSKAEYPTVIHTVDPVFPKSANKTISVYLVLIHAELGTDGRLHNPSIIATPGPEFSTSALQASKQFVFKPPVRNGQPRPMEMDVQVNFFAQ